MSEPIETIIIRAQQDFDAFRGLNPMQIEIKDDRIINMLKKYKNVIYKITPLGILFSGNSDKRHKPNFYSWKKLNGVKKKHIKL